MRLDHFTEPEASTDGQGDSSVPPAPCDLDH